MKNESDRRSIAPNIVFFRSYVTLPVTRAEIIPDIEFTASESSRMSTTSIRTNKS